MYSGSGTNNRDNDRAGENPDKPRVTKDSGAEPQKLRVLIVEDHLALRQSLRLYFEFKGYAVTAAAGYEQALKAAADCPPDVVICDRQLDDSRDGVDVARALQGAYGADIVFVSGASMEELRAETSDLDVIAYLKKPVLPNRIEGAVRVAGMSGSSNDAR